MWESFLYHYNMFNTRFKKQLSLTITQGMLNDFPRDCIKAFLQIVTLLKRFKHFSNAKNGKIKQTAKDV